MVKDDAKELWYLLELVAKTANTTGLANIHEVHARELAKIEKESAKEVEKLREEDKKAAEEEAKKKVAEEEKARRATATPPPTAGAHSK